MKGFWAAVLLFFALTACLIVHTVLITKMTAALVDTAAALPKTAEEFEAASRQPHSGAEQLWTQWDKAIPLLSISVSYAQIDRADEAIAELVAAGRAKDCANYLAAREKANDTLMRIHMLQGVHLGGIF